MKNQFLKTALLAIVAVFLLEATAFAWEIDLSRRRRELTSQESRKPDGKSSDVGNFDDVVDKVSGNFDRQEFVILNTSKGFVPSSVRVKKGNHYTIHIVNVNEDKKNVSFMLDAFAQNHATFYGKLKTFQLDPNKEGIFTFNCPETAAEGRLIVFGPTTAPVNVRTPASSDDK